MLKEDKVEYPAHREELLHCSGHIAEGAGGGAGGELALAGMTYMALSLSELLQDPIHRAEANSHLEQHITQQLRHQSTKPQTCLLGLNSALTSLVRYS